MCELRILLIPMWSWFSSFCSLLGLCNLYQLIQKIWYRLFHGDFVCSNSQLLKRDTSQSQYFYHRVHLLQIIHGMVLRIKGSYLYSWFVPQINYHEDEKRSSWVPLSCVIMLSIHNSLWYQLFGKYRTATKTIVLNLSPFHLFHVIALHFNYLAVEFSSI